MIGDLVAPFHDGVIALAIALFLLALRRSGERSGRGVEKGFSEGDFRRRPRGHTSSMVAWSQILIIDQKSKIGMVAKQTKQAPVRKASQCHYGGSGVQGNTEDKQNQSAATEPHIAIVGCGLIGQSWTIVFLRAGLRTVLFDPTEGVAARAVDRIKVDLEALEAHGLLLGLQASECSERISVAGSLAEAVEGAAYVQENGPEKLETKVSLTQTIDALAASDVPIGSSTSGLPASLYARDVRGRHRCLVVHPINPPHLIPLVEVVPTSWTDSGVIGTVTSLMERAKQVPITLNSEIEGFVVNRLQGALLHEAFRLLEQGIASPQDIDSAISQGLGIRWSLIGPFETIHLNAPEGVSDYIARFGQMYHDMFAGEGTRRLADWASVADAGLAAQMDDLHPVSQIAKAQGKRDTALMKLLAQREMLR